MSLIAVASTLRLSVLLRLHIICSHASLRCKMRKIDLLLVDSFELFREGLVERLQSEPNINVVSTSSAGLEAVGVAEAHKPDVVLIDIQTPDGRGIERISHIHQVVPNAAIVVLTHSVSNEDFILAVRAGARGYILKDINFENLTKTIALVAEGKLVMDPPVAKLVVDIVNYLDHQKHLAKLEYINFLSQREKDVLVLIAKDATNKEIASTLFTSENTVKVHLRNIMRKLEAHNRSELAACAIEYGLL